MISVGKKGLELPINMIIVIAVAVLVLVVVAAYFSAQTGGGFSSINLEAAFTQGCSALRSAYACNPLSVGTVTIPGYKTTATDTATHYLSELCTAKGITPGDNTACARACGCTV